MLFKYTTALRTYFENLPINEDQSLPHSVVIENGRAKLFDFQYPIFDESYRKVFETHFIRNFYMREIGFETVGLFKFQLETWLIINMPYFNKLFESERMQYDPLTNMKVDVTHNRTKDRQQNENRNVEDSRTSNRTIGTDVTSTRNETTNNEQTSTMSGNTESSTGKNESGNVTENDFERILESTTPDSRLSITPNADGSGVIEYASNIKENKNANTKTTNVNGSGESSEETSVESENKTSGFTNDSMTTNSDVTDAQTDNQETTDTKTNTINDIEDYVQHTFGKVGNQSYAKMIQEYRGALMQIEKQIFNEMNELFMLVY